jgi:DNA-binding MarR family transcriptional regulator
LAKSPRKKPPANSAETQSSLTYEEQLIVELRRIARAADVHSHLLQREYGITGPQLATLRVIRRLQPITAGALAKATHVGFATMSGILDRLVAHQFITRTRDPDDRRSVILKITRPGERLLESAPSILQTRLRQEIDQMSESRRTMLLNMMRSVADFMQAELNESAVPAAD